MNNRILTILFAFALTAGAAEGQPYSCTATANQQPIRSEGIAEYVADIVVICSNGDGNFSVPPQPIVVTLNANITSRVGQNNTSESTLIIDDTGTGDQVEGYNIFRGTQDSPNSVRFDNVGVYEPGSGFPRMYRFTNIRVDATKLPPGTAIQATVDTLGGVSLPVNPVTTAIIQQPQAFAVRTCNDSQPAFVNFLQSATENGNLAAGKSTTGNIQFNLRYTGNFAGAYRRSIAPNQDPWSRNTQYNAESNFIETSILGPIPGVATQGTRMLARFNNIPAGVRLFVTTNPLGPGGASTTSLAAYLVSTDANGAGSGSQVSATATGTCPSSGATQFIAELSIVNGTAQAVWEVTDSDPALLEKASFGVVVAYISAPASPGLGTVTVNGRLGPVSTVFTPSATAPAPRFAAVNTNIPAFAINAANNPITIVTPSPLPGGQVGVAYSLPAFTASGGGSSPFGAAVVPPVYTWSVAQGSTLPPGLTLLSNGTFSGVPTTAGTFSFTIQVSDQFSNLATKPFSITIAPTAALTITTASPLPNGFVGTAYSLPSFAATGGSAPFTWTLTQSSVLPPGLILLSTGSLSGTPASAGVFSFTVRVIDQLGAIVTKAFQITISTGSGITTASPLPPGTVGVVYTPVQFAVNGFSPPVSWSAPASSLPPGLTFSSAGVLSGTPTLQGTFSFDVSVSNSFLQQTTKTFSITINPGAVTVITIAPATLPPGVTGTPYSQTLTATGGIGSYTFSISSGSLPSGLTLSSGGLISGTPVSPAVSLFTVVATDSQSHTGSQAYAVSAVVPITPDPGNVLSITTRFIPNGIVGIDYAATLAATGGVTPYTWFADPLTLPPGVSLSSAGVFSGKPTRAGSFRISVRVTDFRGISDGTVFPMTVTGPPLSITTTTLGDGTLGAPYSGSVQATGGIPPYIFGVLTGSLPAGLSLGADGTISGTPTAPGASTFTVQVGDAAVNPQGIATKAFTITILANPPVITTTSLANGALGIAYNGSVAATGGVAPYSFSVASGALPGGLTLASDGTISGTPSAVGDSTFTVQVTDKQKQTASKDLSIKIVPPPSITTNSPLGLLIAGTPSGLSLAATGGTLPFTWSVSGGSLPAGVSLNAASGAITGSPSAAGTYSFVATVTDANKLTATKSFTGRVTTPVRITTASPLPPATVGATYSTKIDAAGGTIPYRFSADTLPAGLSIDTTGLITGTPTAAAAGAFNVTVTDSDSLTASARFTLAVALPQVSGVTIGGVTDTPPPAQQQNVTVVLGSPFPVALTGTVNLTFTSDANVPADDPAIQFSTGGRSAPFTIPAGSTQATFTAPNPAIQTGTVSGTITLTTTLLAGGTAVSCNCTLTRTIRVAKAVPVITSVRAVRGSGIITITIIGFSTSREMTQAAFQFTTAAGSNVTTTSFTVPVATFFTTWYTSAPSAQFGSQFLMTEVFTVSGDVNALSSVSVTLANAQGTSAAVSATVQ